MARGAKGAAAPRTAAAPILDLAAARRVVLDLMAIPGVSGDEKGVAERIVHWLEEGG